MLEDIVDRNLRTAPRWEQIWRNIEKLQLDIIRGLVKFGQDVTVAAPVGSIVPEGVKLIETVKLPQEQDRDDIAQIHVVANIGNSKQVPDIVHDFSHKHEFAKQYPHFPTISHFWHPFTHKYNQAKYNAVCLSQWQADRMASLYGQKSLIMPMCVNTDIYKPISNPARERFLFLGKISQEKGVHLAIRYARELGVPLDVVGGLIPSELDSPYLQTIKNLCDGDKIRLHFNVTEEEKIGFLQNAKALVYPVQQDEAHWLTGMEAWCLGLPTIVFNRGAMSEVSPFTVDTEEEFKTAMKGVDAVDTTKIRVEGTNRYSVDTVIPKYLALYKQVSEGLRWS